MAKKEKKAKIRKAEKLSEDLAHIGVDYGRGDFNVYVYGDSSGIRVEIINNNGDNLAEQDWSWEDLIDG